MRRFLCLLMVLFLVAGNVAALAESGEWICTECGKANITNFCMNCGAKKPEELICPECGEHYPIDIEANFCGNCGTRIRQEENNYFKYEGEGFDTPEDAVREYLMGLKNLDFNRMLGAFAWETQVEKFSFKGNIERMKIYYPSGFQFPNVEKDQLLFYANVNALRASVTSWINTSLLSYLFETEDALSPVVLKTEEEIDVFIESFDLEKIESLRTISDIVFLSPDEITDGKYSSTSNRENLLKRYSIYNVDEVREIPVIAKVGKGELFVSPVTARYGDKWYIITLYGSVYALLGLPSNQSAFVWREGSIIH